MFHCSGFRVPKGSGTEQQQSEGVLLEAGGGAVTARGPVVWSIFNHEQHIHEQHTKEVRVLSGSV